MSCVSYERDLALAVGGDLEGAAFDRLEAHLAGCERCREFRRDLEASQRSLRSLFEGSADETSLGAVRAAVLDAVRDACGTGPAWPAVRWALAACAGAALTGLLIWRVSETRVPQRPREAVSLPSSAIVDRGGAAATSVARRSEEPAADPEKVDPVRQPLPSRRAAPGDGSTTSPGSVSGLTAAEADQLAQALAIVSRIESLRNVEDERPVASSPAIRIATSDPHVVVYLLPQPTGG